MMRQGRRGNKEQRQARVITGHKALARHPCKSSPKNTHVDLNIVTLLALSILLAVLSVKDRTAVIVELEGGDNDVRGVDANVRGGAIGLVAGDTFDMDHPLLAVDLGNLALPALVLAAGDADLVVLADGK